MSQTAVADKMTVGLAGQLADFHSMADAVINTGTNEEASAEIVPGKMVIRGTAADGALKPHTSAAAMVASQLLKGIALLDHGYADDVELGDDGYTSGTTFGVLYQGAVWVIPEDAVTPASDVRVRVVAAGAEVAGSFRGAADGTDCVEITPFARWLTSGDANTPAKLYIDMTHVALATADV